MAGGRCIGEGLFTIVIEAASTSRSNTPSELAEAGIEPSVGSVGDSYGNA
jgi:hypothetical protein